MKLLRFHKSVVKEIEALDPFTRVKLGELFALLGMGESLGLPVSRPMPVVAHGTHELRVKNKAGQYRVFYFVKSEEAVLFFHFLNKKTQATPPREIEVARSRLKEML